MTAGTAASARGGTADDAQASVAAVRSFVGRRRRRSWTDWYTAGFALVIAGIYLSGILASPLRRLNGQAAATHAAALQAVTGAGLVIGAGAGLLLLAQVLGPLVLSPADSSWLLLTPLSRRGVLRRAAFAAATAAALCGALLGVLALAMAGPYLRPAGGSLPGSWLTFSAVAGAGCSLAAVAAVALACLAWLLLWRAAATLPAAALRADSARSGRVMLAAGVLNFSLLFWIAEDNHWRGRLLQSRPWPGMPAAMTVAWADWRRLGRRPGPIGVVLVACVFPALCGAAFTGRAHGILIAAALVTGSIAAGLQGTTDARRDMDSAVLRRLLGVTPGQVLVARAALPALLCAAWLTLALTVLPAIGALPGWWWPLLGLAGPGVAAGVLRLARSAPVDLTSLGPDTPMGNTPPWMVSRFISVAVAALGSYPLLSAVIHGQASLGNAVSQVIASAVVLGVYLIVADARGR